MKRRWLAGLTSLILITSATAAPERAPAEPPVWRELERFSSEAEFLAYVGQVQALMGRQRYAQPVPPPPPSPPPPPMAPPVDLPAITSQSPMAVEDLTNQLPQVFASPAQESTSPITQITAEDITTEGEPSSITNVQTQGVDEGGIVKQIGRFLVVLQDGRLFVVDTRPGGEPGLALIGRTNVYRDARHNTWYDEMLVSGNRVLVTGYSYRDEASEIAIFTIDDTGALTRETTYYISSNDYYDTENYATRLVNGALVIYTPLDLSSIDTRARMRWPVVRRWLRDGERRAITTPGRPLFDARDIYKPVQRTFYPLVHSVSVCPLGGAGAGDELDCRTTAFVGQDERQFYVSTTDIFLWVTPSWDQDVRDCSAPTPATIFQVPLSGAPPRALHARGYPETQLALDASANEFRALLTWNNGVCGSGRATEVRYFRAPLAAFTTRPWPAPLESYAPAPSPGAEQYEVRFTSSHVVYGGRTSYSSYPPAERAAPLSARVIALPLARPSAAAIIDTPHNILRVERAGADAVVTGYRTDRGLSVSLIRLAGEPRIADTEVLVNRYESENRSHAFNALVGPEGDGLMGLPTVTRVKEGGRWWFRSQASDVSFLTRNAAGQLGAAGELLAVQNAQHPSYRCEVSCVDWYGNTRALFIGQRVFALSATELIEGDLSGDRIGERRRLNLSAPPAN